MQVHANSDKYDIFNLLFQCFQESFSLPDVFFYAKNSNRETVNAYVNTNDFGDISSCIVLPPSAQQTSIVRQGSISTYSFSFKVPFFKFDYSLQRNRNYSLDQCARLMSAVSLVLARQRKYYARDHAKRYITHIICSYRFSITVYHSLVEVLIKSDRFY